MNILSVEDLALAFGEKRLFAGISFGIAEGERTGLVGVNGSGKSTLLQVVARLLQPDAGTITWRQGLRVQYLPQNPVFPPAATVLEAVFAGESPDFQLLRDYEQAHTDLAGQPANARLQRRLAGLQHQMEVRQLWSQEAEAKAILTRLGVAEFDRPVAALSGGQRKRVAFAQALIQPADLLILDEPTNQIDNHTVAWLEGQLAKFTGALLLVTHDRYFLDRVATRLLELERGSLYSYEGNYGAFLEQKAARVATAAVQEDRRQNLLRRELAWLRRGAKARTTKQKARIDRVHALRDQAPVAQAQKLEIAAGAHRLGRETVVLKNVGKGYEGRAVIHDFTYSLLPGDRVGIVGRNGAGKSTLLRLFAGLLAPDSGEVTIGATVRLAFFDQETADMDPGQRVIDYIKDEAMYVNTPDGGILTAAQMLEQFLFPAAVQWTTIGALSGGERRRLYLLRKLMAEPNVLLLDEPTNDLDIETLSILEDYLEQFPGAVIAVSHDRYFLDRVADHLFCFEGDGVRRFVGSCSEYLAERAATPVAAVGLRNDLPAVERAAATPGRNRQPLKLTFREQREWDEIEGRIASLEAKVARLDQDMAAAASDYQRLSELSAARARAQKELSTALDRWAELAEKVEIIERERAGQP